MLPQGVRNRPGRDRLGRNPLSRAAPIPCAAVVIDYLIGRTHAISKTFWTVRRFLPWRRDPYERSRRYRPGACGTSGARPTRRVGQRPAGWPGARQIACIRLVATARPTLPAPPKVARATAVKMNGTEELQSLDSFEKSRPGPGVAAVQDAVDERRLRRRLPWPECTNPWPRC